MREVLIMKGSKGYLGSSGRGEGKQGEGVHEAFESQMINKHNKDILPAVNSLIKKAPYTKLVMINSGKEAAAFTVGLMKDTFKTIQPSVIVNAYIKDGSEFADKFWKTKGKNIVPGLFADGSHALASLWNSAWVLGDGAKNMKNLSALDPEEIITLYEDETFLPSVNIHGIPAYLD